jgi:hypothetical protein
MLPSSRRECKGVLLLFGRDSDGHASLRGGKGWPADAADIIMHGYF